MAFFGRVVLMKRYVIFIVMNLIFFNELFISFVNMNEFTFKEGREKKR